MPSDPVTYPMLVRQEGIGPGQCSIPKGPVCGAGLDAETPWEGGVSRFTCEQTHVKTTRQCVRCKV